jgi:hypothetical protein
LEDVVNIRINKQASKRLSAHTESFAGGTPEWGRSLDAREKADVDVDVDVMEDVSKSHVK